MHSPRQTAIELIKRDHRALVQVLELLRHLLRDISARHTDADFHLLSLALYYIDDFPCRVHHPKEDEYLYAAVRRNTRQLDACLEQLEAEHSADRGAVLELHRRLVLFQAGARGALENFRSEVERYATTLGEHMRREEALLDDPRLRISDAEWVAMAEAFSAEDEPLFGATPRREFAILHHRIINLLPHKMRFPGGVAGRASGTQ